MDTIYISSKNLHKVEEFRKLLTPLSCRIEPLPHGIPEAVEDGLTFVENARKKAAFYAQYVSGYALADDSGIVVHALHGEPGIHSARYAGVHGIDSANNQKLLEKMRDIPMSERTADFICAISVFHHGTGCELTVEGKVSGIVLESQVGDGGFGYDPLFFVPQLKKTFAELTMAEKNSFSHRARAVRALIEVWKERLYADFRSE